MQLPRCFAPVPLIAALLLPDIAGAAPAAPRRVAVLDFSASWAPACSGGAAVDDARREQCELLRILADQARGGALAVLRPPAFLVLTRENTAQILKDMGGTCTEGECEVETARLIGASVVVSGEVSLMEGSYIVSLKAHDVATAALLGTGNVQAKTKLELFASVRAETERMLRSAVGVGEQFVAASAPGPEDSKPAPAESANYSHPSRFYVMARVGSGIAWGPFKDLDGRALGDAQLDGRFGWRLSGIWAVEAGAGYINFYKDTFSEGAPYDRLEVKAFSYSVSVVNWVKPLRVIYLAAEVGFDTTSYRYSSIVYPSASKSAGQLHFGFDVRAAWPVGPFELGLRTGVTYYRSTVTLPVGNGTAIRPGAFGVLPLSATVAFNF
jgi:hypothetical protein